MIKLPWTICSGLAAAWRGVGEAEASLNNLNNLRRLNMRESRWIRCRLCSEWHNLDNETDGVHYITFYGTSDSRHRVKLGDKQPYPNVGCLCLKCITVIAELAEEL